MSKSKLDPERRGNYTAELRLFNELVRRAEDLGTFLRVPRNVRDAFGHRLLRQ